jgi:hypothetical protein
MDAFNQDEQTHGEEYCGLRGRGENLCSPIPPRATRRWRTVRQRGRQQGNGQPRGVREEMPCVDNQREASGEDGTEDFRQQDAHADAERDGKPGVPCPGFAVIMRHELRVRAAPRRTVDAPNSGLSRFRNPLANILGPSVIALRVHCVNFRGEKMAGQAGWYRAPGEEGLLRYWNGTTWTNHRQPAPAVTPPEPAPGLSIPATTMAEDTDPMAEYERQFASPTPSAFDLPSFDFDQRQFEAASPTTDTTTLAPVPAPQPQYRPLAALAPATVPASEFAGAPTSVPRSFAPRPTPTVPASLGPIALGPALAAPIALPATVEPTQTTPSAPSEFEQVFSESQAIAADPKAPARRELLAIAAPAPAGLAPNRKAVMSAVRGMGIGIIVIVIGIAAMAFFGAQSLAAAGELKTTGIVTSLGLTTGNSCTPIARFAVKGRSFTADSNTAINPCPVGLGQDVDVIYATADPASAARIQLGTSLTQYLWLLPLLGGLFFLASLAIFVVRAGSILAGIALVRDGGKRAAKPIVTEPAPAD